MKMIDPRTIQYYKHYEAQIGGGITPYSGQRFQKGSGWFGRLIGGIGSIFKSIAPSVAKRALPSAINLAQDIIAGENVGESTVKRLKEAGKSAADETLDQLRKRLQKGEGIIRRKVRNRLYLRSKKKCSKRKLNRNLI